MDVFAGYFCAKDIETQINCFFFICVRIFLLLLFLSFKVLHRYSEFVTLHSTLEV